MPLPTKLPGSDEEVRSLVFVAFVAALATLARVLYGRDELRWRFTIASILVAMATSIFVYGIAASYWSQIGGHMSAAIGAGVGLFTDDVLKRAQEWIKNRKLPGGEA